LRNTWAPLAQLLRLAQPPQLPQVAQLQRLPQLALVNGGNDRARVAP
jgi:hypothetical protein